ncbi:hypothetical protein [Sphingomonas cavernae]|uniref:Pentapeptide MXKDX repeat protein n=1 Tax=Sphingomonas cavernae TaxID=2320861 RepID=A0A418WRU3_9SPHN|nr:hypothetical protein [Sphingomonas cavernae]RJF93973.1 hypothetical protein D3876_06800 [Sphingomonas cavernae]
MKTFIFGLAVAMALPIAAHAAEPTHKDHAHGEKKDCCCCDKGAADKQSCCDKMKAKPGETAKDPHAGRDMSEKAPK